MELQRLEEPIYDCDNTKKSNLRAKTLKEILQIYKDNMNDTIPEIESNKKYQYIKRIFDKYGYDFIDAVIEICVAYKLQSPFAFFKVVIEDYISRGITTESGIKNSIEKLRAREREKRKLNADRFNNFPQRNYDFDILERRLLGWD